MKQLCVFGTKLLLIIGLLLCGTGPVMAQDEYAKITAPFTTKDEAFGHRIPSGSTIYHLPGGITEIRGQDNTRVLIARDSEASLIPAPGGKVRATHIYQVPSGSRVDVKGDIASIYEGRTRILTVVSHAGGTKTPVPSFDGWIESSDDWSVSAIDWFRAFWDVPSAPPDPGSYVVDYIFNAIEPSNGGKIIQPVLEWNYGGSGRWTGAAWVVWNNDQDWVRGDPINVSDGDDIVGTMEWEKYSSGFWNVEFYDSTTSQSSSLQTNVINTDQNLAVFCALEGYVIIDDDDVPGDTIFDNMSFLHNSGSVDIDWVENIRGGTGLTGLDVTITPDYRVRLDTAN